LAVDLFLGAVSPSMSEPAEAFAILLERARQGDEEALVRFIQEYEAELRIIVRVRLGPALRPYLDSMDLVQSVHRVLLLGLRQGRFVLSGPAQLRNLAAKIARNKVAVEWRRHQRQERLERGEPFSGPLAPLLTSLCSPEADPAEKIHTQEVIQQLLDSLSPADRRLVELRYQGYNIVEIARELRVSADSLRMRQKRLRDRLRQQRLCEEWL
jgi:RNA polymerase sigma-70 factor (ECF subfamily)